MAETFTSYVVDNDKRFRNAIETASKITQDLRKPFSLILRDFYRSEQAVFSLKGPGKYPPFQGKKDAEGLTQYQKWKKKKVNFDYPLLVLSGALSSSLLGPGNKGSVANVSLLSLVFGTSIPYAIYHQSDTMPRPRIPLRKFLFIGPEAPSFATSDQMGRLQRWVGYIEDHIDRETKKALKG